MLRVLVWMKSEAVKIIPAIIYFCSAFNLIHYTTGLQLPAGTPRYFSTLTVTIGGLIVGKMLILVNYLPFFNMFPRKPLMYNMVWKFIIYNLAIILFWAVDTLLHTFYHTHSVELSLMQLQFEMDSPTFWVTQVWLYAVFFVFTVFSELMGAIGKEKVVNMIFG